MPDETTVRPPAFRMYPKDILADAKCQRMDLTEFGAYMWLLLTSWEEPLPSNVAELGKLAKRTPPSKMAKIWQIVGKCFVEDEAHPGFVVQPRLEEERAKAIRYSLDKAEAGRRGGTSRAKKYRNGQPGLPLSGEAGAIAESEQTPSKNVAEGIAKSSFTFTFAYSDSLRSSAAAFGTWPEDSNRLRALAVIFLDAFGNCRDEKAVVKHVPEYMNFLAAMRSRGVTIDAAWAACREALQARDSKPLFGASIKSATSYLRKAEPVKSRRPMPSYLEDQIGGQK